MKDFKLNKFLSQADDYLINAAMGGETYSVETTAGRAIVISEKEYRELITQQDDEGIGGPQKK